MSVEITAEHRWKRKFDVLAIMAETLREEPNKLDLWRCRNRGPMPVVSTMSIDPITLCRLQNTMVVLHLRHASYRVS